MEQAGADAVDVTAFIDAFLPRLFGAHVERRAVEARRRFVIQPGGATPVDEQDLAEVAEHDVVGLDVLVDDASLVGVGERLANADEDADHGIGIVERRLAFAELGEGDDGSERAAVDALHGEEDLSAGVNLELVNRQDIGMRKRGRDTRLLDEASDLIQVGGCAAQQLDRHLPIEVVIGRGVDPGGGAGAEDGSHLEARGVRRGQTEAAQLLSNADALGDRTGVLGPLRRRDWRGLGLCTSGELLRRDRLSQLGAIGHSSESIPQTPSATVIRAGWRQ